MMVTKWRGGICGDTNCCLRKGKYCAYSENELKWLLSQQRNL